MVRSSLCRSKCKEAERRRFDEHLRQHSPSVMSIDDLQYLLSRLVFFYDGSDEQRFVTIGQFILKNPRLVFEQLAVQSDWQHRINRLLLLSINQLFVPDTSHAIPLRLLELFTQDQSQAHRHITGSAAVLDTTFSFLVRNGFFASIRKLLEEKTPPLLDGPTDRPPNPFCDALLQLLIRPLAIVPTLKSDAVR